MKKQIQQKLSEYLPSMIGLIISVALSVIIIKAYMWMKDYGDFATTAFVLQAKAECEQKAESDLHRHEDWESKQLKDLNDKIDQIYLILIKNKG